MTITAKPRIIYNDDTISLRDIPTPHTPDKVNWAVNYLKGTQVDILCWCMTSEDIAYSWPSKVMENMYESGKEYICLRGFRDLTMGLFKQGIEYLPLLINRTHEHGIRFFASFRMNDCHHKSEPNDAGASDFWKLHQHYRLWDVTDGLTYYNAALDFSYREVRDIRFNAIVEVAQRYDVDGIEIDFCRNPYTFPFAQAWTKRKILTNYFKKIRNALNRIGKKRGRKIELIIRAPFSDEMLRNAGMDVQAWIDQDLMDILVMSNLANDYNQQMEPWLTRCRKKGILFYPCIEVTPALNPHADIHVPTTLQDKDWVDAHNKSDRALAQNYLSQGVDGVYMFNYPCCLFQPKNKLIYDLPTFKRLAAILTQVGEKKKLRRTAKLFYNYTDLPILVESNRPPQCHQTVKFTVLDDDLKARGTRVTLRFRQEVKKNPHACSDFEQKSTVSPKRLHYYLNGWKIPARFLKKRKQPSGGVTGFTLNAHELVQIILPATRFVKGENSLAFHIPFFPRAEDPYIYIYQLEVETSVQ